MANVNNPKLALTSKTNLLLIRPRHSFSQIFQKIKNSKKRDMVFVEKAKSDQMAAVILSRLLGRKFFWAQGFSNPPIPNFLTKLLLTQADKVIVKSKADGNKLKALGIETAKIRYVK